MREKDKIRELHCTECYSTLIKDKILIQATTEMHVETIILHETSWTLDTKVSVFKGCMSMKML